jgi:hypothetical protein
VKRRNKRLEEYYNDPFPPPRIPTQDELPARVDYSTRAKGDYIISGPLYPNQGHGRSFLRVSHARKWAERKFGEARVSVVPECLDAGAPRWALLIKKAADE